MSDIAAGRIVLRAIDREVAAALLVGETPDGVVLGPGYPSQFSLEVLEAVAGDSSRLSGFGPYFILRREDDAVVGEIGGGFDAGSGTVQVGYTVVEPCWGQGFATESLRALLGHLLADPDVDRVTANTFVDHAASRRVMEKAGMRVCGTRTGEEDGEPVELVVYEAVRP